MYLLANIYNQENNRKKEEKKQGSFTFFIPYSSTRHQDFYLMYTLKKAYNNHAHVSWLAWEYFEKRKKEKKILKKNISKRKIK